MSNHTHIDEMVVNGVTMVPKESMKSVTIPVQSGTIGVWQIGKSYLVRTVTYHLLGKLLHVTDTELVFTEASWLASSGRFNEALKTGMVNEVEPFINDVIVGRSALIDATIWDHKLPTAVK